MNKIYLFILSLLISIIGFSQEKDTVNTETIAFSIIENSPIFPGCEKLDKKLHKMCLQNQIQRHVAKYFNTKLANEIGLEPGKTKLYVVFKIASDGLVKDIKARAVHKALEVEGIRVISSLPKMIPGKNFNKPVGVKYTIPITLIVDKKIKKKQIKINGKRTNRNI